MKKKKFKIFIAIFICPVVCYSLFVTFDCIRLKNSNEITKPIITIEKKEKSNILTYKGIGYSVSYYIDEKNISKDFDIYGAEFRLFNKILIWSWVN